MASRSSLSRVAGLFPAGSLTATTTVNVCSDTRSSSLTKVTSPIKVRKSGSSNSYRDCANPIRITIKNVIITTAIARNCATHHHYQG